MKAVKASIIVVAAGSGVRLGANVPKAFVELGGESLLAINLRTIGQVAAAMEAVVAAPLGWEDMARRIARVSGATLPIKVIAGGEERQDSVRIALELTSVESEIVAIHDAARPLASVSLFDKCIERAAAAGAAIAAAPLADTLKRGVEGLITETVPRAGLWQAQTPQAFRRGLIVRAHAAAQEQGWAATDDAELVERLGAQVALVESSSHNFKITTPDDLKLAELVLRARGPHSGSPSGSLSNQR